MRIPSIIFLSLFTLALHGATISFSGTQKSPIVEKAPAATGLNDIYVLFSTDGVMAEYTAKTPNVTWSKFGSYGGAYAEEIPCTSADGIYSIALGSDDYGYIIEDGTDRYYFWVVNYANHYLKLDALTFHAEQECDRARLMLQGDASQITYYTINGQGKSLGRDLAITYTSLKYDEASEIYMPQTVETSLEYIDGTFGVAAPLCDTQFTLRGDKFLKHWGLERDVKSDTYAAIAVEACTHATQEARDNDNEQRVDSESLGGSAPVVITFTAAVTDAAIYTEWQLARDPEFETIDDRFLQPEFEYTFRENGNTYVRFICNNAAGTCEYIGETYTVMIGESALLCPNAFSPGASEGVNDEWKVSYKSIVKFECHIFNRWGQLMCTLSDPSQGWDGKYKDKLVPTGAYYYVIKAEGADGRKYDLSGDINILRSRTNPSVATPQE